MLRYSKIIFTVIISALSVHVDLKNEAGLVQSMPCDNLTEWPPKEKLPPDFDPAALLETAVKTTAGPVVNPAAFIEKK